MFKQLPDNARVWVYQSNRVLTDVEKNTINEVLNHFTTTEWHSHDDKVSAEGTILYNRFIVLAANDTDVHVGGCSIDSSVKLIKAIDDEYQLDLFNRFNVAYKQGDAVLSTDKQGFKQLLEDGKVDENTTVFNNMITTKSELLCTWEVPVKDSWHATAFRVAQVS